MHAKVLSSFALRDLDGGMSRGQSIDVLVPVSSDTEGKSQALERIGNRHFIGDAGEPQFLTATRWIAECGREVRLPLNFCGGLLIIRVCRAITPHSEQTAEWTAAIHEAAAAYDYAFLALGHADDEADNTLVRDGRPTRFVTHPGTRAVDGINLLLTGLTGMQECLTTWPPSQDPHPLNIEIMRQLVRALREASFPIILDRTGLGHDSEHEKSASGLGPIRIDADSLSRVEAFARHRAHTYFMRATELATLLAGYAAIAPDLWEALDELFRHWGALGAAKDDLEDLFLDFEAGIHSICTVMAHLCVAEEVGLRPSFRQAVPYDVVEEQRKTLMMLFGESGSTESRRQVEQLLATIDLRKALRAHLEQKGIEFAEALQRIVLRFDFPPALIIEVVAVVCRDPGFVIPKPLIEALKIEMASDVKDFVKIQAGRFIGSYLLERHFPA